LITETYLRFRKHFLVGADLIQYNGKCSATTNFLEDAMKSFQLLLVLVLILSAAMFSYSQKPPTHSYINLPEHNAQLPFSDGVLVGDTLYLAGRLGLDPKTGKVPEEVEDEVRLILEGMKATLKAAGMSMDDLVYVQVFSPNLDLYDPFNTIYRTYFSKDFPARAFIGSGPLLRNARFEVVGIAVMR
jgi:2-iminobutanoate/2-iminopropanoate deaminase